MRTMRSKKSAAEHQSAAEPQNIKTISIKEIVIPDDRRACNPKRVVELAESMQLIGLRTPITVRIKTSTNEPELVTGLHRLRAAESLGWKKIQAVVMQGSKLDAKLWEIAENLFDHDLSALERAEHINKWIKLVQRKQVASEDGSRRRGRPKGGIAQAARKLKVKGKSEEARRKSVARDVQIAHISPEAKELIKEVGLDNNPSLLLQIAKEESPKAQISKVHEVADRKRSRSSAGKKRSAIDRVAAEALRLWRGLQNVKPGVRQLLIYILIRRNKEFAHLREALERSG